MSASPKIVFRSPGGTTVWKLEHGFIMWSGPGSRLRFSLADPRKPGSPYPFPIEHHSADGEYRTTKDASAAVRRFVAAGSHGDRRRRNTRTGRFTRGR